MLYEPKKYLYEIGYRIINCVPDINYYDETYYDETYYDETYYDDNNNFTAKIGDNIYIFSPIVIYIGVFIVSTIFTILIGYLITDYYFTHDVIKCINDMNNTHTNSDTNSNTKIENLIKRLSPIPHPKLYTDSLSELARQNNVIISKMKNNSSYFVLLRIKMKNDLLMQTTKYNLHNKLDNVKTNSFTTKDMFMVMGFNYNTNMRASNGEPVLDLGLEPISNIIVKCINYINHISEDKYVNEDFVVAAIGRMNEKRTNEFYDGLVNINYELFNVKNINVRIDKDNAKIVKYILTLPIYNVYNAFMDIYNDIIFESSLYKIDDKNFEYWDSVSISDVA